MAPARAGPARSRRDHGEARRGARVPELRRSSRPRWRRPGLHGYRVWLRQSLGLLALALGQLDEAADELEARGARPRRARHPLPCHHPARRARRGLRARGRARRPESALAAMGGSLECQSPVGLAGGARGRGPARRRRRVRGILRRGLRRARALRRPLGPRDAALLRRAAPPCREARRRARAAQARARGLRGHGSGGLGGTGARGAAGDR